MASVFCTNCGSPVPEGSKFCTACGTPAPAQSSQGAPASANVTDSPASEPMQTRETIYEPETEKSYAMPTEPDSVATQTPARSETYSDPVQTWQPIQSSPPPQYTQKPVQAQSYQQPQQQWQPPVQQQVRQQSPPPMQQPYVPPAAYPASPTISTWGYFGSLFLMNIPVIGLIAAIIWAVGSGNLNRRNLARGYLLLLVLGVIILAAVSIISAILLRDQVTSIFEAIFPGYSIEW